MTATEIDWRDGVPVARRFDDPYYSLSDGLAETEYVFLQGNRLEARWPGATAFRIAELGFGTGLNALAARALWRRLAQGRLLFTSFERYPLSRDQMARALAPWPALEPEPLIDAWPLSAPLDLGDMVIEVIEGDARTTLPAWTGRADAWFLDGFSPAKNPELWEPALLQAVRDRTAPGGTAATYTAAGHVRRALETAGFTVKRIPGFGGKRHMTVASEN